MTTPTRKIASLKVWAVCHPQNPLIAPTGPTDDESRPLAIYYKKKDALAERKAHASAYKVVEVVIDRLDGTGQDYRKKVDELQAEVTRLKKELEQAHEDCASLEVARSEAVKQRDSARQDADEWHAKLTPRAKSAISLGVKESEKQGATYTGTEHILLGLLKQGEGIAFRHFVACGMTYDRAEYAMRVGRCS